ncbi:unnamed protein product [Danaus chrysippus]|uniref:(African queen) hypothetical protein n=1 Tax=Danaus chrysippus TaxID=151541 RepID=A0A8J2WDJ7_9NEOP|nr:unnamed protein product [Danaus chrysippus]
MVMCQHWVILQLCIFTETYETDNFRHRNRRFIVLTRLNPASPTCTRHRPPRRSLWLASPAPHATLLPRPDLSTYGMLS